MRTTIIPAQITTVEDKIAGSLNMSQILILMTPVLWTALVYIVFFPTMKLVPYKLLLILAAAVICFTLALRIKDKIVAEWLRVLVRYRLRPKKYLFNKNDLTDRIVDVPTLPLEHTVAKKQIQKATQTKASGIELFDLVKLEHLIDSGKIALRYEFSKKRV
jgi:hypothetical protein